MDARVHGVELANNEMTYETVHRKN
jgi:hypothetical protein